jgi:hypothetical protein
MWATFNQGGLAFTTGQTRVFDLLADANIPSDHAGFVIQRVIFQGLFHIGAQDESWNYGMIVSDSAIVGTAAPSALARPDLWWTWIDNVFDTASGAANDQVVVRSVDSRTKRRIHGAQETLALSVTQNGAASHNASFWVRTLVALP